MRNLATLFFSPETQTFLDQLLRNTHAGQNSGLVSPSAVLALMDEITACSSRLDEVSQRLQVLAASEQAKLAEQTLADAGMILLPGKNVMSLMDFIHEETEPHCQPFPFSYELKDLADYRSFHPVGFRINFNNQWLACNRDDWESALHHAQSALDNHVGLLASIGFRLTLNDPGVETISRLAGLMDKLAGIRSKLWDAKLPLLGAVNASQPSIAIEAAYTQFRTWYASVLKADDPSHAYLPPHLHELMPRTGVAPQPVARHEILFDLEPEDTGTHLPVRGIEHCTTALRPLQLSNAGVARVASIAPPVLPEQAPNPALASLSAAVTRTSSAEALDNVTKSNAPNMESVSLTLSAPLNRARLGLPAPRPARAADPIKKPNSLLNVLRERQDDRPPSVGQTSVNKRKGDVAGLPDRDVAKRSRVVVASVKKEVNVRALGSISKIQLGAPSKFAKATFDA